MTYKAFGDIGFGWTKFIDSNGKRILRPSIYSEMPIGLDGNETGIESPIGDFLFGDSAQNVSAMPRQFRNYEDCLSDAYAANVLLAISEMNGGNIVDCELVLSLPYQSMRGDLPAKLMARLTGGHIIKRLGYHKQTINITFPVKFPMVKFSIMPQNIAPAFVSLAPNGRFKSNAKGTIWIGIINVGSKTLELGTFGIDVDSYTLRASSQHMTFPKGIFTLADSVQPLLIDALQGRRTFFSQHEVFDTLITNTVQDGNVRVDVGQTIDSPRSDYLATVHNHCLENWNSNKGKEPGEIYQYCGAGGGAYIVAPYLKETGFHNNIVVSDDPQFDVCIGSMNWHKLIGE